MRIQKFLQKHGKCTMYYIQNSAMAVLWDGTIHRPIHVFSGMELKKGEWIVRFNECSNCEAYEIIYFDQLEAYEIELIELFNLCAQYKD